MNYLTPDDITWGAPLPAPAKINLFLHVVGRRPDGYHLLQSAFRLLDRADVLRFHPRNDDQVRMLKPIPGVPEDSDLCVRAARLLQEATGCKTGVSIEVEKNLPMGGGLGGGSSDAATVLLALNRLWQLNLPRQTLQDLGLRLGADVPFFVFGRNAFAEGVGEALQPLSLPEAWYLVVEPPVGVPTSEIFSASDLTRNTEIIKIADFPAWAYGEFGRNDLEPVACRRYPEVAEAKALLDRFGPARMSGSGACVFVAFRDKAEADEALAGLPDGCKAWVARGLEQHPLFCGAG